MKFVSDSEQVDSHSALGQKPISKPFDYHDNALDSTGLKSGNNTVKKNQKGVLSASKAKKQDVDGLPYATDNGNGWPVSNHVRSMSLNNLTNDNEKDVRDPAVPCSHSSRETESFEDSDFYMDKSVTECELPELIVCYKESTYHVKDICIDDGVQSRHRILFENDLDQKGACIFLPPKKDRNGEIMEEKISADMSLLDVMKSTKENDSIKDIADQCDSSPKIDPDKDTVDPCDSKDLMLTGEVKGDTTNKTSNYVSKELLSLGHLLSMEDSNTEYSRVKSSSNDGIEVENESFQGSSGKAVVASPFVFTAEKSNGGAAEAIVSKSDSVTAAEQSSSGNKEAVLAIPALVPSAEEKHNNSEEATLPCPDLVSESEESTKVSIANKLLYNSKVETGSITFDFDASAAAEKGKDVCPQNGDSEHMETPHTSRVEDAPRQSISSQVDGGFGETSFSVAGPLPSMIGYSGPVPYSGSVSLRSDSSTTSTRSFAFPVLQNEWNSSPVRMAKADRKLLRKQKGWRQGLLCCRF